MRQAGRSLPAYRAIRQRFDLFEICRRPELCAEVTLQPVDAHGVDAAVIYSDIMLPVSGMGVGVALVEGVGPVVAEPIRREADLRRLGTLVPEDALSEALESIRLVRAALAPERAVVGFVGGPFTVAGYLVEGRPSRSFTETKRLMYGSPELWHALMDRLSSALAAHAAAQARAGADVLQLFDSWVGVLSAADYREFVAPYSKRVLDAVRVPRIHFATGCTHLLPDIAAAGGDVVGLDWRVEIDHGWEAVGLDRGIQGNLDPASLLGPFERVQAETVRILQAVGGRPGHIFNLGHGVLPETDPAALRRLCELVHAQTATGAAPVARSEPAAQAAGASA
jgi:uroporphyrinogen decarboxylase